MATKKITVLGDTGDSSVTPEEAQKIEIKIDKMLSLEDRAPSAPALSKRKASPRAEPAAPTESNDELPASVAEESTGPSGAPPLDKPKLAKKIMIIDHNDSDDAGELTGSPKSDDSPNAAPKIPILSSKNEVLNAASSASDGPDTKQVPKVAETATEADADSAPEPGELSFEMTDHIPKSRVEGTEITDKLTPQPLESTTKKYRPPDGPLPFKRALDTETVVAKPGAGGAELSAQELEDLAIAQAFEAKEPGVTEQLSKSAHGILHSKLVRALLVVLLIGLLAGVAYAVPSVRHRVASLLHTSSPAKATTKPTAPALQPLPHQPAAPIVQSPDIYLAKQAGIYNLYKINSDGQNKQQLLAGSGYETSPTTQLVANQAGTYAALASLRDASKDDAGYPLQTLTMVDVAAAKGTVVTQAQRLDLLGWSANRLVYVASKTGASAANDANSYQLISYDVTTKQKQVLDHATHFNAALTARGFIYYATAGTGAATYRIKADGSGKQTVLNSLVTKLYRSDYDTLSLATAGSWYTLDLANNSAKPLSTVTAYTGANKLYVDAPDGKSSLHVETISGTPTLLRYDVATKKDTTLKHQAGLTYPVHWLTNSVAVYRIDTDQLTADYTIDFTSGVTTKLTDTSSFHGLEP